MIRGRNGDSRRAAGAARGQPEASEDRPKPGGLSLPYVFTAVNAGLPLRGAALIFFRAAIIGRAKEKRPARPPTAFPRPAPRSGCRRLLSAPRQLHRTVAPLARRMLAKYFGRIFSFSRNIGQDAVRYPGTRKRTKAVRAALSASCKNARSHRGFRLRSFFFGKLPAKVLSTSRTKTKTTRSQHVPRKTDDRP